MVSKKTVESVILGVLDEEELPSHSIREELEKRGIPLTYDELARYLKRMTSEHEITREARGKPWRYYYKR